MNCCVCLECGRETYIFCCQKQGLMAGYCSDCLPALDPVASKPCHLCNKPICMEMEHLQKRLSPLRTRYQPALAASQGLLQPVQGAFRKDAPSSGLRLSNNSPQHPQQESNNLVPCSSQRFPWGRAGRREEANLNGYVDVPHEVNLRIEAVLD